MGDRIFSLLSFSTVSAGDEASFSITYRQRLLERSWDLFTQHPFLGDQLALQKLTDMRQGEGIIDMVNTYVEVSVFHGFIGLSMFVGFILIALVRVNRMVKQSMRSDSDLSMMGLGLIGSIVGTLFMLGACSFIFGYEKLFYVISGLAAAYINLGRSPKLSLTTGTQKFRPIKRQS